MKTAPEPWVSRIAVALCVAVFLGFFSPTWQTASKSMVAYGLLPERSVWEGSYWTLFTSVFVHFQIWHVLFNVYWLWMLGSRMEEAVGSWRFLAFFVCAAFVSSALQLAASGDIGVGASGVVYAIFGFMWVGRRRFHSFQGIVDDRTAMVFLVWLVGCVVLTMLNVWRVGNAAHVSGLLFGAAVAGHFVVRYKPPLALVAAVTLVVLSIVPLFWCPWSVQWFAYRAYKAHVARDHRRALDLYTRAIALDPENAWAYHNRGLVFQALGMEGNAKSDMEKAQALDPSL
ncbi:MAG: rhomboid family intramembrane serine protease, partial [Planctomycetota bacterium]|nr:rhomboid family intramembrane serine protease [Planctomycetota bacterium]